MEAFNIRELQEAYQDVYYTEEKFLSDLVDVCTEYFFESYEDSLYFVEELCEQGLLEQFIVNLAEEVGVDTSHYLEEATVSRSTLKSLQNLLRGATRALPPAGGTTASSARAVSQRVTNAGWQRDAAARQALTQAQTVAQSFMKALKHGNARAKLANAAAGTRGTGVRIGQPARNPLTNLSPGAPGDDIRRLNSMMGGGLIGTRRPTSAITGFNGERPAPRPAWGPGAKPEAPVIKKPVGRGPGEPAPEPAWGGQKPFKDIGQWIPKGPKGTAKFEEPKPGRRAPQTPTSTPQQTAPSAPQQTTPPVSSQSGPTSNAETLKALRDTINRLPGRQRAGRFGIETGIGRRGQILSPEQTPLAIRGARNAARSSEPEPDQAGRYLKMFLDKQPQQGRLLKRDNLTNYKFENPNIGSRQLALDPVLPRGRSSRNSVSPEMPKPEGPTSSLPGSSPIKPSPGQLELGFSGTRGTSASPSEPPGALVAPSRTGASSGRRDTTYRGIGGGRRYEVTGQPFRATGPDGSPRIERLASQSAPPSDLRSVTSGLSASDKKNQTIGDVVAAATGGTIGYVSGKKDEEEKKRKKQLNQESYDYFEVFANVLVNEGYVKDYDGAVNMINSLDDDGLNRLASRVLNTD